MIDTGERRPSSLFLSISRCLGLPVFEDGKTKAGSRQCPNDWGGWTLTLVRGGLSAGSFLLALDRASLGMGWCGQSGTFLSTFFVWPLLLLLGRSVVSNSLQPHVLYPTRLLCPWESPGENTGVGWHFLLHLRGYSRVFCSIVTLKFLKWTPDFSQRYFHSWVAA